MGMNFKDMLGGLTSIPEALGGTLGLWKTEDTKNLEEQLKRNKEAYQGMRLPYQQAMSKSLQNNLNTLNPTGEMLHQMYGYTMPNNEELAKSPLEDYLVYLQEHPESDLTKDDWLAKTGKLSGIDFSG